MPQPVHCRHRRAREVHDLGDGAGQQRALDADDPHLRESQQRAWGALGEAVSEERGARSSDGPDADAYAAFALVHGLASMWLSGAALMPGNREAFTSAVLQRLVVTQS